MPEMDQVTEKDQPERPSECQLPEARKRLQRDHSSAAKGAGVPAHLVLSEFL